MAKERSTPEEQLLKLIEEDSTAGPLRRRKKRGLSFDLGGLKLFFAGLRKKILSKISRLKTFVREPNLKTLNKAIVAFCILLTAYSISDFIIKNADVERVYRKLQALKHKEVKEDEVFVPRSFLYYLEMVQRRNIFSPIALQEPDKKEVKEKDIVQLAVGIKVVGISWGPEPVAMIEDTAAKKTYFLKKGDTINQLKIKDILRDKVILSYKGKTLELM